MDTEQSHITLVGNCAFLSEPYPIHGNPSFQKALFGETKIASKCVMLNTFLKHAISNFPSRGIGYCVV